MALVNGTGVVNGYQIGSGEDLTDADLSGAYLEGADLSRANLQNANLEGANLKGAHLMDADLYDADLAGADLRGADLTGANLGGAILTGADLTGAFLTGANFAYAKVDPAHVPLIEAACRDMIASLRVRGGGGQFDLGDARHFSTYMPHGEVPGEESAEPYKPGSRNNFYGPDGELPPLPVNRNKPGRAPNPDYGTRRGPHGYKY
jgi:hypothetical protein